MFKRMINRFKIFPLGTRRLLIAGVLVFPFILGPLAEFIIFGYFEDDEIFITAIWLGIPAYIVIVFISAWIYKGFKIKE